MAKLNHVSWGWYLLVPILSVNLDWDVTGLFSFSMPTHFFIPVLTGWLARRHGAGIVPFLLFIGVFSAFRFNFTFDYVFVNVGIPLFILLLALSTAIAFVAPRFPWPDQRIFNDRWKSLRWALIPAIFTALYVKWPPSLEFDGDHLVGINLGFALVAAILLAAINWGGLKVWVARVLPNTTRWQQFLFFALAGVFLLSLIVYALLVGDEMEIQFGDHFGFSVVLILAFVLPACGVVNWKASIVVLIAFFAFDWTCYWVQDIVVSFLESRAEVGAAGEDDLTGVGEIVVTGYSIKPGRAFDLPPGLWPCVCATLLAVALRPFWREGDASRVQTSRSILFTFLSFTLLIVGIALGFDERSTLLFCGIAFAMGLIWQVRAVIGAPLIIMIGYLLAIVLTQRGYRATANVYELVNISLMVFPFAYFGLLASRRPRKFVDLERGMQ